MLPWDRIEPWDFVIAHVSDEYHKKYDMVEREDIQQSLYEEDFSKNNIKLDNKILLFIGKYNIIIRQGAPKKNEKIASKNYRLVEGIVKYVKIHLVSIPKLIESKQSQ
jgi:hypothetical protein